jgi:beta-glucosidase|tara:strand:+ start:39 stop:545 length:507 start_codon:yes stop_codon:yes gene_type:complete
MILGPSVNVNRIARGGRNGEYISGEDAYLGARMAAACDSEHASLRARLTTVPLRRLGAFCRYVRGVQREGVAASVKHFVLNSQETNRNSESSHVNERALFEIYYAPFQAAIEAGAAAVMCGYNKVDGEWACNSEKLLVTDLRETMNFKGFVQSDWCASKYTRPGRTPP